MKSVISMLTMASIKSCHPTCQKRSTRITIPNKACSTRLRLEEIPPAKKSHQFSQVTNEYTVRDHIPFLNIRELNVRNFRCIIDETFFV
jgi:hypothetical protein